MTNVDLWRAETNRMTQADNRYELFESLKSLQTPPVCTVIAGKEDLNGVLVNGQQVMTYIGFKF